MLTLTCVMVCYTVHMDIYVYILWLLVPDNDNLGDLT